VQGHRIAEAEAKEKFEWLSLAKVIQVSSNIGAAKVALKLGADHYLETLHSFGFSSRPSSLSRRDLGHVAAQALVGAAHARERRLRSGLLVTPLR